MKNATPMRNKVRTISGVTPVAVITKPWPCPGNCIYCPHDDNTPQSYLKKEPAVARALLTDYDPRRQVEYRLKQYSDTGHDTSKIELIILGGSWSAYPKQYRLDFISGCLEALNGSSSTSFEEAITKNETAPHRMVGLGIETRPDLVNEEEIRHLRDIGVTKVELGVQSTDEEVLKLNNRGHNLGAVIKATELLKNHGFKVLYHIMPGLYGSTLEKDINVFETLFNTPEFQPDMLKIYPCVVIPGTELSVIFKKGDYIPYSNEELVDLLVSIKKKVPPYVRIMRLFRDIPAEYVEGGSTSSNLRELVAIRMKNEGVKCRCIRCREIREKKHNDTIRIQEITYRASRGTEVFLEYIDTDTTIYALLRLRIPDNFGIYGSLKNTALIRELHVYGPATSIGKTGLVQHRGLGKLLLNAAETIAKNTYKLEKIAVISGIGVRDYYRNLGYELADTYMIKNL